MKEGEGAVLEQAREIKRYGAAVVVMAFDEQGQADTHRAKGRNLSRSYQLLTREVGFPPKTLFLTRISSRSLPVLMSITDTRLISLRRAGHSGAVPACADIGWSIQCFVFVPRKQPCPRGNALGLFVSRDSKWAWTWPLSTPDSWRFTRKSTTSFEAG